MDTLMREYILAKIGCLMSKGTLIARRPTVVSPVESAFAAYLGMPGHPGAPISSRLTSPRTNRKRGPAGRAALSRKGKGDSLD